MAESVAVRTLPAPAPSRPKDPPPPFFGDTPKGAPDSQFGDTPKRRRKADKKALETLRPGQRLVIKKQKKDDGRVLYIVKTGRKGSPYFRATTSKTGYAVHFRHKDGAGKWVEPYACYLSAEEFSQIKSMSFSDLAFMIALKIEQRRPSAQITQKDLKTLLLAVQSCID